MFPRHNPQRRAAARLILLLACALSICALPTLHARFARAAAAGDGGQAKPESVQIPSIPAGQAYRVTTLLSDSPGLAPIEDPLLVNPWGITSLATSPFWIANNGTSTTQLVRGDAGGQPVTLNSNPQTVNIPGGLPTGAVANATSDFAVALTASSPAAPARFIFDSITGNIVAWQPAFGNTAKIVVSLPGHVYTGLAIGANAGGNRLYAADFANNHVDVFDGTFTPTTVTGGFIDPTVPADHHVFNIQNIGGSLYVTYAKVGPDGRSANGPGLGYVRKFNTDGVRDLTFAINNGPLDAPWGLTIAPASFGLFANALLVGNFSDNGIINAFNPSTGAFLGTLQNEAGQPIVIDELWGLIFGNGAAGGDPNTLYFTAGIGEEEHGLFGKITPTTATATSLVQFAADSFAIGEGGGHIDITVTRAGDASGTATVNYATFDESQPGHASQKSDYELAAGTLTFAPGETSKTFRVLIVNDKFVEGNEDITLVLTNPTGAGVGLGSPNISTLTIIDNDAAPTTSNPIDDPSFFVRQHYLDFFNREPDAAAAALANQIAACGADAACVNTQRVAVSTTFFTSPEFFGNGSLVIRAYKAAFGTNALGSPADVLYGDFEIGLQALQRGVTPAGGAAQLEANTQAFFAALVARPDFVARYATTLTPAQFVDQLFANAGVTPTAAERSAAINEFASGATNTADQAARARALRRVAENAAFAQADASRDAVSMAFFAYLRRDPDASQFSQLLARMSAAGGDIARANLVRAFITAPEYRQRFGADPTFPNEPFHTNAAPTAGNDTASTNSVTPVTVGVLANDSDPDGDFLVITSVAAGTGGTPSISPDGRSVVFTPAPGFAGTATFQYTVTDNGLSHSASSMFVPDPKSATATVTVTVTSAGTFQFGAGAATVGEGDGKITLTVTRAGDTSVPVTVDYATAPDAAVVGCAVVNGQASERCDFETAVGTLRFAAGETSKTFDVFIIDDARVEGNETFTVTLSNPTGANFSLGGTTSTTVTITDNDAAAGPNPIDGTAFFVRQQYLDFLNREPDAAGFNAWVATLTNCAAGDASCDRVAVSSKFFLSDEFQARGYFAIRFYRAAFARNPLFREFVGDMSRLNGATAAESAALKTAFVNDFVQRPEFVAAFGSLSNAQFVDKLIANTGVTFTAAQRDQFVADLNSAAKTRAQVLRDIVESLQFANDQATFNRAFVLTEYFGYLRRDPDTPGFNAWVATLNANPSAFRAMVNGFVNSAEYRLRFGNP